MESMGGRIHRRRKELGLTQQGVGRMCGVSKAAVGQWESDQTEPTGPNLVGLARALQVSESYIVTGRDKPKPSGRQAPQGAGGIMSVAEIAVTAAAGGGSLVEHEEESAAWSFPADWARHEFRAGAASLRIITIVGDSMANPADPACLLSGDKAVVNVNDKTPSPPGAFAIWDGFGLIAKRLELIPNSEPPCVRISSANPAYQPYERTVEEINIVGRIVGTWRRL